jgi:archaellum biogenesis ATPase FlaH
MNIKDTNITFGSWSGDLYQILQTIKLCLEMLRNQSRYKHIRIEYREFEDFIFDDICLEMLDGTSEYFQIKYSSNPSNSWTLNDFFDFQNISKSFIKQSYDSYMKLKNQQDSLPQVKFFSNTKSGRNLNKCLKDSRISSKLIEKHFPQKALLINDCFSDTESFNEFLENFELIFAEESLDDALKKLKQDFSFYLRISEDGFNSIWTKIHERCTQRDTKPIDIQELEVWSQYPPKENVFANNFKITDDFQIFDNDINQSLQDDISNHQGGIRIITGGPGCGKSNYLAKLHSELLKQNYIVIKHDYYVREEEKSSYEKRLNSNNVINSLKILLRTELRSKGIVDHEVYQSNSSKVNLSEYIEAIINSCFPTEKLVLIIDGLDHVTRDSDLKELERVLQQLTCPDRFWLILGTQEQVLSNENIRLFKNIQDSEIIKINGLGIEAIFNIIDHNLCEINFPANPDFDCFKEAIFNQAKVSGLEVANPLYLHYLLHSIANKLQGKLMTLEDLKAIPKYGESIEEYYSYLWNDCLKEEAKRIIYYIISSKFSINERLLKPLACFDPVDKKQYSERFASIKHLIVRTINNRLHVYHYSFLSYVLKNSKIDFKFYENRTKEYFQHRYNFLYENQGIHDFSANDTSQKIDHVAKDWLINSILSCKSKQNISTRLEHSLDALYGKDDFDLIIELHGLSLYLYNNTFDYEPKSTESASEELNKIFQESLTLEENLKSQLNIEDFSTLPSSLMVESFFTAPEKFDQIFIRKAIGHLKDQLKRFLGQRWQASSKDKYKLVQNLMILYIGKDDFDINKSLALIHKASDKYKIQGLMVLFVHALLRHKRFNDIESILKHELSEDDKEEIVQELIKYSLLNSRNEFDTFIFNNNNDLICELYLLLKTNEKVVFELSSKEIDSKINYENYESRLEDLYDLFLMCLINTISSSYNEIDEWLKRYETGGFEIRLAKAFVTIGRLIGNSIQTRQSIPLLKILDIFQEIDSELSHFYPFNQFNLSFYLRPILERCFYTIRLVMQFLNITTIITDEDIRQYYIENRYSNFTYFQVLQCFNSFGPLFQYTPEAYTLIIERLTYLLRSSIEEFRTRSEKYLDLAILSKLTNDQQQRKNFLYLATHNLLSYGDHKDRHLFYVLDALSQYYESKKSIKPEWFYRFLTMSDNILLYTNGKETHHLKYDFLTFLAKVDFTKALRFYYYYQESEIEDLKPYYQRHLQGRYPDLFDLPSEKLFFSIIDKLDFSETIDYLLVLTACFSENAINQLIKKNKLPLPVTNLLKTFNTHLDLETNENDKDHSEKKLVIGDNLFNTLYHRQLDLDYVLTKEELYSYIKKEFPEVKDYTNACQCYIQRLNSIAELLNGRGRVKDIAYIFSDFAAILIIDEEKESAFDYLVQAQQCSWYEEWFHDGHLGVKMKKVFNEFRWRMIEAHFRDSHKDFFVRSIKNVPYANGIKYMLFFNDSECTDIIMESILDFSESLMADVSLPQSFWYFKPSINKYDLFFSRLKFFESSKLDGLLIKFFNDNNVIDKRMREGVLEDLKNSIKAKTEYQALQYPYQHFFEILKQ